MKQLTLAVVTAVLQKDISKRQAAVELGCGYSTLCNFCRANNIQRKLATRPAKYNESAIRTAVQASFTFVEVCNKLGIPKHGGSFQRLKERINLYKIDTSHIKQVSSADCLRKWQKSQIPYVVKQGVREPRKYLLALMVDVEEKCSACGLRDWLGLPLKLHVDHIDGNHGNNTKENLQFLCPNCHTQKTYPVLA